MLFLDRRTPQSDQNPKNFQFHQKQLKFPIDCATSHPNRPTELRDIIENRTFFYIKKGCERDTEYPFKGCRNVKEEIEKKNKNFDGLSQLSIKIVGQFC